MLNENFLERRREDDAKRQAGIGYDFYIAGILGYEKRKNKGADQLLGDDRTDVTNRTYPQMTPENCQMINDK